LLILSIIIFSSFAYAQDEGDKDDINTIINTNPPGAAITLNGEYVINATSPCRLPENINGFYQLMISQPGYESWSGEIVIMPGQNNRFDISLSSKTRYKAALRSLFLPGWGQYYSERKSRAYIYNAAAIGLGVAVLLADRNFRTKRDDYQLALNELENAASLDELSRLQSVALDKNRQAYDAESTRNLYLALTAGLYVYNILDAVIFFPEKKMSFQGTLPSHISGVKTSFDGERINFVLTASF